MTVASASSAHVGRYRVRVTRGRRRTPVPGALVAITGGGRRRTMVQTDGHGYATFTASARATVVAHAQRDG